MDTGARRMIQIDKIAGTVTNAGSSDLAMASILEWSRPQGYKLQLNRPALGITKLHTVGVYLNLFCC